MTCDHLLDDCGCCADDSTGTRGVVNNTPGLPQVQRRVGTAHTFAGAMSARLTQQDALEDFTNRRSDDPAIALVDAWSVVLDVLTFYNERLTNETYLRTALEPRSLTELAHTVGYVPGRGRASATLLSFTMEDAPGSPSVVPIPARTKVASLPGPGEVPQNYETTSDLQARPEWNAIPAQTRVTQGLGVGATQAYVDGIRLDVSAGDALLLVGRERESGGASAYWAFRLLSGVHPLPEVNVTRLTWVDPLGSPAVLSGRVSDEKVPDPRDARLYVLRRKAAIFGAAAPDYRLFQKTVAGTLSSTFGSTATQQAAGLMSTQPQAEIQEQAKTKIFWPAATASPDWPDWSVVAKDQPENTVDLDAVYPTAVPQSWVVMTRSGVTACYRVLTATEVSRTDYALNAKVSRLSLQGPTVTPLFNQHVRQTSAYVGSELLPLATEPILLPVQGDLVDLAEDVPTLEAGRTIVVRGPRPVVRVAEGVRNLSLLNAGSSPVALHPGDVLEVVGPVSKNGDGTITWTTTTGTVTAPAKALEVLTPEPDAVVHAEAATIASPTPSTSTSSQLQLSAKLTGCYHRASARILANTATASHGETKSQVLGSGDASASYQRFTLMEKPLTYVAAASGGAVVSTLEVRVDGRLWTEVPQLFGVGPTEEVYTTQMQDDGTMTVTFGDGLTGSRVPTGTSNVTATYRAGTGLSGRVAANTLTLPMTRPLGLRSVTNPLATGLAADLEPADAVRAHAPQTVLTLGRVVSLKDFEDFARSVPGIGKAKASWIWDGKHRLVHLTVFGAGGQSVDDQAIADLGSALRSSGDPRLPLRIESADVITVTIAASVVVDPRYVAAAVHDDTTAAITAALSADARELAQALTSGDVIMAAHGVPGVVAITITAPTTDVPALPARIEAGTVKPAQLVVLAAGGLDLTETTS